MRALQFAFPITLVLSLAGVASAQTALQLRWELKGDVFKGPADDGASRQAFTLTNRDTKPLPARGWAIYFDELVDPLPGPVQGGVAIERVSGELQRIVPGPGFAGLAPARARRSSTSRRSSPT